MLRSVVMGVGGYLPKRVLTNAELSIQVDTSDEWIVERTGIRARYIADDSETTASSRRSLRSIAQASRSATTHSQARQFSSRSG